ncbi:MAG: hydrogenase maturation protease [Acidimicrobiales bacterium]
MIGNVVVAGIGNRYRGDDGVGVAVASLVAQSKCARDIGPISEPLDLLGRWEGASLAVLVDATRSKSAPGTVLFVELDEIDDGSSASTHAFGLRRVCRIASALGDAPRRVVVVGIEGEDFSDGDHLSGAVAGAVTRAAAAIEDVISQWEGDH